MNKVLKVKEEYEALLEEREEILNDFHCANKEFISSLKKMNRTISKKRQQLNKLTQKHNVNCEMCNDLIESDFNLEGFYFFCSRKCMDEFEKNVLDEDSSEERMFEKINESSEE